VADSAGVAWCVTGLMRLAAVQGAVEQQARFMGAMEALLDRLDVRFSRDEQTDWERQIVSARTQLEAETFARAWATGQSMTVEQAGSANGHAIGAVIPARPLPPPP
jgi:hypothetical protein